MNNKTRTKGGGFRPRSMIGAPKAKTSGIPKQVRIDKIRKDLADLGKNTY
jgi:hypothetical protein